MGKSDVVDQRPEASDSGFLPVQPERSAAESIFVRLVATAGIIAVGTALGAGLSAWTSAAAWLIALIVSIVAVVFAAVLWRSRTL
jgi:protein-S-isoprenylcysteine O-methyltransferase Ste14